MFQTLFQNTNKIRRTTRLQVETLERRDMQAVLPVAYPTLAADWPTPPTAVQTASLNPVSAGFDLMITRSSGEEIPQ